MLVRTNDGFSGFNAYDLYSIGGVGRGVTFELPSYDAGTERNNERQPYLIALSGDLRDPEGGVVTTPHPGIRGDADAPKTWDFDPARPVARVTITRVKPADEFPAIERLEAQESFDSTPR